MKYIDADKLIKGIKYLQEKFPIATYEALYHLITSLQQDQPSEDLEKEIDKYIQPIQAWEVQEAPFSSLEKCARHFYELGFNARTEDEK